MRLPAPDSTVTSDTPNSVGKNPGAVQDSSMPWSLDLELHACREIRGDRLGLSLLFELRVDLVPDDRQLLPLREQRRRSATLEAGGKSAMCTEVPRARPAASATARPSSPTGPARAGARGRRRSRTSRSGRSGALPTGAERVHPVLRDVHVERAQIDGDQRHSPPGRSPDSRTVVRLDDPLGGVGDSAPATQRSISSIRACGTASSSGSKS